MITVAQATALLGVTRARIRVLCKAGRIPGACKVGRDWLLPDKPVVLAAQRRRPGKLRLTD